MSLRLRLVVGIGAALIVLWTAAATWMFVDLDRNLQRTLDERLAMSANMVSGLMRQSIAMPDDEILALQGAVTIPGRRSMACQVRSLRGEVIATTRGAAQLPLGGETPGYETRVADGVQWRTFTVRTENFSITTADSMTERTDLQRRIALAAGLPFLIAAIGGLVALWLGVGQGLAPLERLRQKIAARTPDSDEVLDVRSLPLELQPLAATLNDHQHRTAAAMGRERHFTNDAAHELRTPLTAIDTHLQVARMTIGAPREQALADAAEGVGRLRSALEQLLLLARVEGRQTFDETNAITAEQALQRAIGDAQSGAPNRVQHAELANSPILAMPAALAGIALRNLIDNALSYSPPDTPVEVMIEDLPGVGLVEFTVVDRGRGLGPDPHRAAERFWRGNAVAAGSGSGLGLAIVDAIAQRYGGSLSLESAETVGTRARLRLPRMP